MSPLIIAILMAVTIIPTASAQEMWKNLKNDNNKTIYFRDKATGEQVGSGFVNGNRIFLRDRHNNHYATVVKEGTTTKWFDPHGQPLDPKTTKFPTD